MKKLLIICTLTLLIGGCRALKESTQVDSTISQTRQLQTATEREIVTEYIEIPVEHITERIVQNPSDTVVIDRPVIRYVKQYIKEKAEQQQKVDTAISTDVQHQKKQSALPFWVVLLVMMLFIIFILFLFYFLFRNLQKR